MAPVLALLCFVGGLLFGILTFAVFIFQVACRWCRLERPGFFAASGIVVVSWIVWAIVEAIMISILQEVYRAAGYPPWEARIVGFFIGLPSHMLVTTVLHMGLMRVKLGKAIEVWFIQQMMLFSIILAITGVLVVGFLAAKN
ncbi:hypothetical protein [Limnoglobus roseus]|uniref:Uncharacterized protein n=1 Tax=Limnoglobus roseus TaxID=2598579 RepID=A0A5C1AG70_9BACT|nr:hypothetical protein [Limnoglobus roseus]QEL17233.1 hypothetical protein PX52LOC_04216 [Limnoglobus roseus]